MNEQNSSACQQEEEEGRVSHSLHDCYLKKKKKKKGDGK
jgi:hypothetical protein